MPSGSHRYILLVFSYILSPVCSIAPSTLRHVNLLYRHGDRGPIAIYPKDINQIDKWPFGLGWLTNIGKQQQYELGQYLRNRYDGFLNISQFDHEQVSVQASAVDRCLMSAASNLAGFFPPEGFQVWNKNIPWQPIPIKSVPVENDNKLAISKSCARYDQLLGEQYVSERVLNYIKMNKDFFTLVSKYTGLNESLDDIWRVTDTLVCEEAHNMTLNDWAQKEDVFEKLKEITMFGWDLLYYTAEMAKLKGGPLLKDMIENMKMSINGSSGNLKLHMYSAHDTTVASLLRAMTVSNNIQPPYRTLIMVELHHIDGNDIVKVLMRNDTKKAPYNLLPRGCEDPCKFSTFQKVLAARVPQDWDKECEVQNSRGISNLSPASWIALVLGLCLLGTIIIGIFILVRRKPISYMQV